MATPAMPVPVKGPTTPAAAKAPASAAAAAAGGTEDGEASAAFLRSLLEDSDLNKSLNTLMKDDDEEEAGDNGDDNGDDGYPHEGGAGSNGSGRTGDDGGGGKEVQEDDPASLITLTKTREIPLSSSSGAAAAVAAAAAPSAGPSTPTKPPVAGAVATDAATDDDAPPPATRKRGAEGPTALEAEIDGTDPVGRRVCKKFLVPTAHRRYKASGGMVNKVYFGTVTEAVDRAEAEGGPMYLVVYDDGDQEHYDWKEVVEGRYFYESNRVFDRPRTSSVPPRKRRGRPPKAGENVLTGAKANASGGGSASASGGDGKPRGGAAKKAGKAAAAADATPRPTGPNPLVSSGPPDEKLEGGWPKGWVKKVYQRKSGATKGGTDKYWFTPVQQYKLRSMAEVKKFLAALKECDGDEVRAKQGMSKK